MIKGNSSSSWALRKTGPTYRETRKVNIEYRAQSSSTEWIRDKIATKTKNVVTSNVRNWTRRRVGAEILRNLNSADYAATICMSMWVWVCESRERTPLEGQAVHHLAGLGLVHVSLELCPFAWASRSTAGLLSAGRCDRCVVRWHY